jgi:ammonia channel protein AmtB
MMVTSAPRWVSLTLEPFSLLLIPGALFAWAEAAYNKLDFSGTTTIHVALLFYFFAFALLLLHRLKRKVYPSAPPRTGNARSR